MADKSPTIDINDPYRPADYDFGVLYGSAAPKASWTDGLPHNFQGWGPQTPDPDAPAGDSVAFQPDNSLNWVDEGDDHQNHHVWHFDGRRRHHH
jgi:hypothetical protein